VNGRRILLSVTAALFAGFMVLVVGRAQAQDGPRLHTNEAEIGEAQAAGSFDVSDPKTVLGFVLGALPERVQVLPTENYYYFRFTHRGVRYVGNIRLAAADRDKGVLHFSYSEQPTDWNAEPTDRYGTFGAGEGVVVESGGPLTYRVTANGRTVTFVLNDVSKVLPPDGLLTADEKFLGPVFDESGVRFFLVFNARHKVFHFLLDETAGFADELFAPKISEGILIGKRTGFAFYRDGARKILIGASERQSRLNTYFDGPFDQLPENFIEGDTLRDAMVASEPGVAGTMDRLGNFSDGSGRFLIHPYMLYRDIRDLAVFHRCAVSHAGAGPNRPLCFVIGNEEAQRRNPRPLGLGGRR